jgi:HK97 family phage major capsid protein
MAEIAASAKTILIGDFSYYWIVQNGGWSVDRNPYLYMANGQVGFFARQRVDGRVVLAEAFAALQQHA